MEFVKNKKGNLNLVYREFIYNCKNVINDKKYWRCIDCNVTMISESSSITKEPGIHNHPSHEEKIIFLKSKNAMLQMVEDSPKSRPREIFNTVREEKALSMISSGSPINLLPRFKSVRSVLHSKKRELFPDDRGNLSQLNIPIDYQQTKYGQPFLLNSTYAIDDFLIFGSLEFLNLLCSTNRIYVDGTFDVAPRQFTQLFTIHILINEEMFCAIYALLPDKKLITYRRLIQSLKSIASQHNLTFNPRYLHCDFELSIIQSMKYEFPNIEIHGCYFHFSQALLRKVQNLGLKTDYDKNNDVKMIIKRCIALPLMKIDDIEAVWFLINEANEFDDERLDKFLFYIQETWISDKALFPKKLWNHFANFSTRTNNHLEGFHNKLNRIFDHFSPNLFNLIDTLKSLEIEYKIDLSHALQNKKIHHKNKKYVNLNQDYEFYTQSYINGAIDLLDYLDLSTNLM